MSALCYVREHILIVSLMDYKRFCVHCTSMSNPHNALCTIHSQNSIYPARSPFLPALQRRVCMRNVCFARVRVESKIFHLCLWRLVRLRASLALEF